MHHCTARNQKSIANIKDRNCNLYFVHAYTLYVFTGNSLIKYQNTYFYKVRYPKKAHYITQCLFVYLIRVPIETWLSSKYLFTQIYYIKNDCICKPYISDLFFTLSYASLSVLLLRKAES